jgi:IS5 family transposase
LEAGQVLSLWDEVLPIEARELPEDLRRIDVLLADSGLLAPIRAHWDEEAVLSGRSAVGHGRPTIAMASYVRLMVVKQRSGWGYETLVREVSDSLHLRRFCLIAISERVPDESTIRKLTRRLGHETVDEITRLVIAKAQRETRFLGRAVRVDSTVIEADIRYPSDAMLALQGTRALAREGASSPSWSRAPPSRSGTGRGRSGARFGRSPRRSPGEPARPSSRSSSSTPRPARRSPSPPARRGDWPPRRGGRPGAAARRPSCTLPPGSSSSPSAARRSPSRSAAAPGG